MTIRAWIPLALILSPFTLLGQEGLRIEPGARVRITAPALGFVRRVGTVTRIQADTLSLDSALVPLQALTHLEVNTGRKSQWVLGMGIGALGGAVLGAAVGSAAPWGDTGEKHTVLLGAVGAAGGSVIGLLIGSLVHHDQWRELPLEALRIGFGPHGGTMASLTLPIPH